MDFSEVAEAANFAVKLYFSSSLGDTLSRTVNVRTVSSDFSDLTLRQPAQGASAVNQRPTFIWQGSNNATAYVLEVDKSPAFTAPITALADDITTVILDDLLDENTLYYWRVQPQNECGPGSYSPINAFHTLNLFCQQYVATDVPKNLSQSGIVVAQSTIEITNSGSVSDVNITSISGFHDSFGDLIFTLLSPSGKEVKLVSKECGFSNKVFNLGFDDQALDTFSCQVSFNNQVFQPRQPLADLNGESVEGGWTLQVADSVLGSGGRIEGWSLELCGSLTPDPPVLARLDTLQAQFNSETILDDDVLRVEDNLASANQLLFTLVSGPVGGVLLLDGTPLLVGGQFSQAEISMGSLVYSHNGLDSLADQLIVTVINGQGAWIGPLTLPIEVSTQVVSAFEYQLDGFIAFPNPVENVLHLTNSKFYQGPATIRIFRIDGTRSKMNSLK